MTTPQTIRATSDTRSLLNALSKAFTNTTTFIGELLQNARRAGATLIHLNIGEGSLEITDNGLGIADFGALLSVAISGWDEEVRETDSPYGMGFFAAIFAAKRIEVESRGARVQATTADILALNNIPVEPVGQARSITRIRLEGIDKDMGTLTRAAEILIQGFPIPVILNGTKVERRYAAGVVDLVKTRYGMASPEVALGTKVGRLYLQGLPIKTSDWKGAGFGSGVIHLDPKQYEGRMPDRDTLCNQEESFARLQAQMADEAIERLTTLSRQMPPDTFIASYGEQLRRLGADALLNSFDYVPGEWIATHTEIPRKQPSWEDQTPEPRNGAVARSELGAHIYGAATGDLAAQHLLAANDKFVVAGMIPPKHWASDMIVHLAGDEIACEPGELLASEEVEIDYDTYTVQLVASIDLVLPNPVPGLPRRTRVPCYGVSIHECSRVDAGRLYVTPEMLECIEVLLYQIADFEDEHGSFSDESWDASALRLRATLKAMGSTDASQLLTDLLNGSLPYVTPKMLRGRTFGLCFDDKGKLQVQAQPEAA